MTTTQVSIETAPRDIPGLKNLGRFNMRVLAQLLGGLELEATKTSFMQQTTDQQADFVQKLLQEHDGVSTKSKGAGGASQRQPSTKGAAGKTTNGAAGKTTGAAAQGTGGGTETGAGTAAGVGAGAEKILKALKDLSDKVDGFQASVDNLAGTVAQLQGFTAGTNRAVTLSIGLTGKLAEQALGASLEQILDIVLDDMPVIEAAMQRMAPAEDAEDAGEGNDEE